MGLLLAGIILWIIGKATKIKIIETIGFYMMIAGAILFALGFVGIHIGLPF